MPAVLITGAQWGDEGKGRATDLLGSRVDYVVKFNGGNNAGHTVVIGDQKYALHLLPSGILTPGVVPVIANGVVVDLAVLKLELDALKERGVDVSKLKVSANAHVITEYHRTLDKVTERFLGKRQIGTTGRGIGPAYADKINRVGIRIQDIFDEGILRQKVEAALDFKNQVLVKIYNRRAIDADEVVADLLEYRELLEPMVCDTGLLLHNALADDKTVLYEAGQATMLDIDHGTYPFVTSSNATSGGASTGSGVPPAPDRPHHRSHQGVHDPRWLGPVPDRALRRDGRVPADPGRRVRRHHRPRPPLRLVRRADGPLCGAHQRRHRLRAHEARRALRASSRSPSASPTTSNGVRHDEMPVNQSDFHHAKPIYQEFPGWEEDITGCRKFEDLPKNAQDYIVALEAMSGARFSAVGVGPEREQVVVLHDLLS